MTLFLLYSEEWGENDILCGIFSSEGGAWSHVDRNWYSRRDYHVEQCQLDEYSPRFLNS